MLSLSKHPHLICLIGLLSACSSRVDDGARGEDSAEKLPCALRGAEGFAANCTIERNGGKFVIRHPDGGFRRFEANGDKVSTADGALPVQVTPMIEGGFELKVAGDRYRTLLPAPTHAAAR
ncbi:hypothetical protein [Novosphingobium sp. JCM 18896]|uniref:hypothetical protein n=1 Tax=Novosphingobium sp. JCM 18896 TaxID=2989731 RepID=UPI0022213FA0|nr:hypothetical protein [Novosphingobium sp. JCM 18896]MCW1431329.1 hypothetical protein [Novosphingobium sp. JCM 18896]